VRSETEVVRLPAGQQQGSAALEATMRAVGEAMAAMQALWERIAPQSHWCPPLPCSSK
jgi:hypothetical protein